MAKDRGPAETPPLPTASELGILRVLWNLGPSTVRAVQEELNRHSRTGYTTVLKFLQIMHQKGLVNRDDGQRAHIYAPALSKEDTQARMTRSLLDQVYDGSRSQLVLKTLGEGQATQEELKAIRELLNKLEQP